MFVFPIFLRLRNLKKILVVTWLPLRSVPPKPSERQQGGPQREEGPSVSEKKMSCFPSGTGWKHLFNIYIYIIHIFFHLFRVMCVFPMFFPRYFFVQIHLGSEEVTFLEASRCAQENGQGLSLTWNFPDHFPDHFPSI